ncbi:uncharacterized protein TNCV_3190041 [Trichonephila clavipes]|nr:uncharacterized protein TNCV_3190041 [Trichonephila clavipes]
MSHLRCPGFKSIENASQSIWGGVHQLNAFIYDVCIVRMGVVIHKHNLWHPRTDVYVVFQNNVLVDLACHVSNLNMHVSTGTQNNSPKEQSCMTIAVSVKDVLLVVTGIWHSPYENPVRIRLQA